jgi:predicted ATPase
VLATSQAPLEVPGAKTLALRPLATEEEAQRLFFARSGLDRRDVGLTSDERSTVEPLYVDLHGNAAALEIAAAQVRRSGFEHTVDARRRRSLSGDASNVMRLAVLSSLQDAPEAEAAVFARLAAMPDWFTLEAARAVAGGDTVAVEDVPTHLRALVDRALVVIDVRDVGGQRFRFLPSVREIAAEQLEARGEVESASRRHADHYLRLAEQARGRLQGRSARRWLARLEAEQQHFRAALRWGVEHDRSVGFRLAAALWLPCLMRSNFSEARHWMAALVTRYRPDFGELPPEEVCALAEVALGAGYLAYHQADYADAERQLELFHALQQRPGARPAHADDVSLRGLLARRRCQFAEARALLTDAAAVNREEGRLGRLADRLNTLGNILRECRGDLQEARRLQEESLAIFARLGDLRGAAMVQCDLGYLHMDRGELGEAHGLLEDSLATRKRVKDAQGVGQSLNGLGRLARQGREPQRAIRYHEEAAELFQDMGDELRLAESFEALALALAAAGRGAEAPAHLARAGEVRARVGAPPPPVLVDALQRLHDAEGGPGPDPEPDPEPERAGRFTRQPPTATPSAGDGSQDSTS